MHFGAEGSFLLEMIRDLTFRPAFVTLHLSELSILGDCMRKSVLTNKESMHATILELQTTLFFVTDYQIRLTDLFEVEKWTNTLSQH